MAITVTGRTLVSRSLRLIGALGQGETASAADAVEALAILNGILDDFGTQRLTMPAQLRAVFDFVADQADYTIGPTDADWTATRPTIIEAMAVLVDADFEIPLAPFTNQSYDANTVKALTSPFPTSYYWNATFPNATVTVWPVPTDDSTYQAVLYTPSALDTVTLDTSITLPNGYYRALYYLLARELEPAFSKPPNPSIDRLATQSLLNIKRLNLQMTDLMPGTALPGTAGIYNIDADQNY